MQEVNLLFIEQKQFIYYSEFFRFNFCVSRLDFC